MPITVSMIEEKEFKTKMRGYDPVEVDEFLDEICDEMVAMQEEITALNQRLSQASRSNISFAPVPPPVAVPAPIPAPAPAPAAEPAKEEAPASKMDDTSESAQRLLNRAQKVYDETVAEAKAQADEILRQANARAESTMEGLEEERDALQKEVDMLKAAARDYRERFLRLLEDQQHVLKAETALFE